MDIMCANYHYGDSLQALSSRYLIAETAIKRDAGIVDLPTELVYEIFKFLNRAEMTPAALVNRLWNRVRLTQVKDEEFLFLDRLMQKIIDNLNSSNENEKEKNAQCELAHLREVFLKDSQNIRNLIELRDKFDSFKNNAIACLKGLNASRLSFLSLELEKVRRPVLCNNIILVATLAKDWYERNMFNCNIEVYQRVIRYALHYNEINFADKITADARDIDPKLRAWANQLIHIQSLLSRNRFEEAIKIAQETSNGTAFENILVFSLSQNKKEEAIKVIILGFSFLELRNVSAVLKKLGRKEQITLLDDCMQSDQVKQKLLCDI